MSRHEDGQAMAEFALVLPMLAMLTFGTIEVTMWLQQQSALNAAAFMAARSASVLGGDMTKTKAALGPYADASPRWLGEAVAGMKARGGARGTESAGVDMVAGADRFSGLIAGLTGGEVKAFDTLSAGASLPMEYVPKRHKGNLTGQKPRSMISYRVEETEQKIAPKAIGDVRDTVKQVRTAFEEAARKIQALLPKDVPVVTPSSAPKPKPLPSGAPKPAPKPAPSAGPSAALIAALKKVPAVNALNPQGVMFETTGSVIENPKKEVGTSVTSSLFYVSPAFEGKAAARQKSGQIPFCAASQVEALAKAEKDIGSKDPSSQTLSKVCQEMRVYLDVAKKAVVIPGVPPIAKGFEDAADKAITKLGQKFDNDYKLANQRERNLFKGGR